MKKQNILKALLCLILSCCMLWIQCCTIAGGIIGGLIGEKKGMVQTKLWDVQIGTVIEVYLFDNEMMKGEYRGFGLIPHEEYEKKYKECKAHQIENPLILGLGDSITIHLIDGEEIPSELEGFGITGIKEKFGYSILARKMNDVRTFDQDMRTISGMSTVSGEFINREQLNEFIDCCIIPLKCGISVKNADGIQYIALNEVVRINETIKKRNIGGAIIGLLLGAAIDLLFPSIYKDFNIEFGP